MRQALWRIRSKDALAAGNYCSVECRGRAMRNRVTMACGSCGTKCDRPASVAAKSKGATYCSKACMTAGQRADPATVERTKAMGRAMLARKEPTRCEEILYDLLDTVLGDGLWQRQFLVFDKWTVDAAVPELRLILQADGDYWHGRDARHHDEPRVIKNRYNDASQNSYAAKAGWRVERFWEGDLKKEPDVCLRRLEAAITAQMGLGPP